MGKARKRFEVFPSEIEFGIDRIAIEWFWRLKSANSKIHAIGGEGFSSRNSAINAAQRMNDMLAEPLPIEVLS